MQIPQKKPNFQTAADVFDTWRDDVLTGQPPTLYPVGDGEFARVEVGPKLVTLIGGAPGAGKTALAMQFVVDALRLTDSLRVAVCNSKCRRRCCLTGNLPGCPASTQRRFAIANSTAHTLTGSTRHSTRWNTSPSGFVSSDRRSI